VEPLRSRFVASVTEDLSYTARVATKRVFVVRHSPTVPPRVIVSCHHTVITCTVVESREVEAEWRPSGKFRLAPTDTCLPPSSMARCSARVYRIAYATLLRLYTALSSARYTKLRGNQVFLT